MFLSSSCSLSFFSPPLLYSPAPHTSPVPLLLLSSSSSIPNSRASPPYLLSSPILSTFSAPPLLSFSPHPSASPPSLLLSCSSPPLQLLLLLASSFSSHFLLLQLFLLLS
jgi:hypothetical protein